MKILIVFIKSLKSLIVNKKLIPNNNWLKIDPDPILRQIAKPININLIDHYQELIAKMQAYIDATYYNQAKTLNLKEGIAVAAPQLGMSLCIIYIHFDEIINQNNQEKLLEKSTKSIEHKYLLANPKIIAESLDYVYLESGEGCLSIEKKYEGFVFRKRKIIVEAIDLLDNNQLKKIEMQNFLSLCFQHELDHLHGILYYDRISKNNFEIKPNALKI